MSTFFNGFEVRFSAKSFRAFVSDYPDASPLSDLRAREGGEWFLYWREGTLYGLPEVAKPARSYGTPRDLDITDHHHLGLLASRLNHQLPAKFPAYEALRSRPFAFLGQKDELVAAALDRLRSPHPLTKAFKIRPKFELDARIYELRDGDTRVGLFVAVSTKWDILATPSALLKAGVDLRGLHVVRQQPREGERRLVGEIDEIRGGRVHLAAAYDGIDEIDESQVWIEGGKRSFKRCLSVLLRGAYSQFERRVAAAEGELLGGPGLEGLCHRMLRVLSKASPIELTEGLDCRVVGRLQAINVDKYDTVVDVGQGEYCFDPAKKKRSTYAWPGIEEFGPYSRETFAKKTPRILVVSPDKTSGQVSQFIGMLKHGITSIEESRFAGGMARLFNLHNPEFTSVSVPVLGTSASETAIRYRKCIEATLRKSSEWDAALVAILDEHAELEDRVSPYLHAKAMLLGAGIPVQEFRMSTATQQAGSLQHVLQNIAIALYAKMGGVPWTVDQGLAVDDEVVIGIGVAELSANRFEKRERYVGLTTVFRGDGNYLLGHLSRDCSYEEYPAVLEENTVAVLEELRDRNGWRSGDTVRVVFHAHRPMKRVEVARIVKACLDRVGDGLQVEFAFVTVSKDHPFKILDPEFPGFENRRGGVTKARMVPPRGRVVQLGRFTRLLCTKGPTLIKRPTTPLPSPLLIRIHEESTYRDLQYLSEQILKFTNLSWTGTQPVEDPVSICYSELMAGLLARLRNVPGWSPAILNTRLRHSMWAL